MTKKPNVNAGVHNAVGIEFQKHFALHFLLENFASLKDRKYFICLEHHDDVLFGYLSHEDLLEKIDAFQAKKSSEPWSMSQELYDILIKIVNSGIGLSGDLMPKSEDYSHTLQFVTNNSIKLNCGNSKKKLQKKITINESNNAVRYVDLDGAIQTRIKTEVEKVIGTDADKLAQLENISLAFVDLSKTAKTQKDSLVGHVKRLFGDKVLDASAAVESLLLLFREVENVLNQNNTTNLLDKSKQVNSGQIGLALDIITTQSKAFDLWRNRGADISKKMEIPVLQKKNFELHFTNSFDLFKDLKQVEHRNILAFVTKNIQTWEHHTDEVELVANILSDFKQQHRSNLNDIELKAAIFAATVQHIG